MRRQHCAVRAGPSFVLGRGFRVFCVVLKDLGLGDDPLQELSVDHDRFVDFRDLIFVSQSSEQLLILSRDGVYIFSPAVVDCKLFKRNID